MNGLEVAAGATRATLVPELGMMASSWRHGDDELLVFPATIDDYARTGAATAAPLLFPWANRLAGLDYTVDGRHVDLAAGRELLQFTGPLPIHGVLPRILAMTILERRADQVTAAFEATPGHPLLTVFPFPHRLTVRVTVGDRSLEIETTLAATGAVAVPVSFGYHPYLALPSGDRDEWVLSASAAQHLLADDRLLPTGALEPADIEHVPLGGRSFDDGYTDLGSPGSLSVAGAGRRLTVHLDEGYPFAQVYAPPGERFVALEPMTAPANALTSGAGLRFVEPGGTFTARFTMTVD